MSKGCEIPKENVYTISFKMAIIKISYLVLLCICIKITQEQNTTSPRRSGHNRDSNLISAIQQIQLQLSNLENDIQRQTSRIQDVARTATRLEAQRQDLVSSTDRSEARLSQRLDDLKGDVRKVSTLQDVMRDDIEKIQQNQLLLKVWIEEQLRQITSHVIPQKIETSPEAALYANADILANLQVLQTTLYGLRRMVETIQGSISIIKSNITELTNLTRLMHDYELNTLVSKTYLQSSLQMLMDEKMEHFPLIGYVNPIQNYVSAEEERLPRDCKEVQEHIQNKSGIYRIQMKYAIRPIFVYCDMETEGGGWTVFQRRKDGSVDFLREWQDYKHGFGNVGGEFWLGNENLYLITHQDIYELWIDLYDFDGGHVFAKYNGFAVGSEKEKYMLKLLGPLIAGDAGDGMTYHASIPFSTIDVDNDRWEGGHCAKDHSGGWWYNQCDASNLNGKYLNGLNPYEYQGVYWHEWQGPSYSLMATQMMIRPLGHNSLKINDIKISNNQNITNEITPIEKEEFFDV